MQLSREQAVARLNECERWELADYAFGDSEFTWTDGDKDVHVAVGYKGRHSYVTFFTGEKFEGDDLRQDFFQAGCKVHFERNDQGE